MFSTSPNTGHQSMVMVGTREIFLPGHHRTRTGPHRLKINWTPYPYSRCRNKFELIMEKMNDLRLIFLPGVQCPRAVTGEWSLLCALSPLQCPRCQHHHNITTSHLCCCLYFLLSREIIAEPEWDNSSPSPDTDNFILLSARETGCFHKILWTELSSCRA